MKKLIAIICLALSPMIGFASSGNGPKLDSANIDLTNQAALQNGAKLFVNYCSGCHSAKYFRYERMQDFGLDIDQISQNLIPGDAKIGDLMTIAMPKQDAARWFGAPIPDLTLEGRLRSADWLYSYLRSFYSDESRPMGVNNKVFPNVGMPNVLWELQGVQRAVYKEVTENGHTGEVIDHLEMVRPGKLTPAEFDAEVRDLVTFLMHISEPMKLERQRIGVYVMLFLLVFFVVAFLLKKEYWKDIH